MIINNAGLSDEELRDAIELALLMLKAAESIIRQYAQEDSK